MELVNKNTRPDSRIIGHNVSGLCFSGDFKHDSAACVIRERARLFHQALGVQGEHVIAMLAERQLRNEFSLWPSRAWPIDEKVGGFCSLNWLRCTCIGRREHGKNSDESEQS